MSVLREPKREPWGLDEMWVADPDGVRIAVVEIPESTRCVADPVYDSPNLTEQPR